MRLKGSYIVVATMLVLSAGIAFDSLSSYINPYLTVKQVLVGGDHYLGRSVQIMGVVAQNSISREEKGFRFDLTDGSAILHVVYSGAQPQNFEQGKEVVVIGTVRNGGLMEASSILVKCPSKYQDEGATPLSNHLFLAALLIAVAAGAYFAYTIFLRRGG